MKIFLLWAVVFNVLSYGLFVSKDNCKLILKGCLEVTPHCKCYEDIIAARAQSEILGYINGVDRAYSNLGIH